MNSKNNGAKRKCETCLWNWPDIENPDNTARECHNEISPFYRRVRRKGASACDVHENRVRISDKGWSSWCTVHRNKDGKERKARNNGTDIQPVYGIQTSACAGSD